MIDQRGYSYIIWLKTLSHKFFSFVNFSGYKRNAIMFCQVCCHLMNIVSFQQYNILIDTNNGLEFWPDALDRSRKRLALKARNLCI